MKQMYTAEDYDGYKYEGCREVVLMDINTYAIIDDKSITLAKNEYSFNGYAVIDKNIADIVSELNKKGYHTYACCEGHAETPINKDKNYNPVFGFHYTYIAFTGLSKYAIRNLQRYSQGLFEVEKLKDGNVGLYLKNAKYIPDAESLLTIKKSALKVLREMARCIPTLKEG